MENDTILVVDSDLMVMDCMAEALASEGYTVYCYGSNLTADVVAQLQPDLLIVDHWRLHTDLASLLERLRQGDDTRALAVMISSTDCRVLEELVAPLRGYGCTTLLKPFDLDQLFHQVANALGGRPQLRRPEMRYA